MAARVTMADIALAAGVSSSTVSRALNNHPTIPEATRAEIQAIATQLNYRVDVRARNFRLQRSQTVATLFPYQGESHRQISDPFYLEIIGAITAELDQRGYDSIIARVHIELDDWCERYVLDKRVDGILLIDRAVDDVGIVALQELGANFVVWGAQLEGQNYVTVGCDSAAGARDAVHHLASLGRRHIGFIGGFQEMVETDARKQGYLQGMIEADLPVDGRMVIFTDFTPEAAAHAVNILLKREPKPDAIFVCSDFMAVAVMEALRRADRLVPDDVAVVGCDDIPLASYCSPRLTTIHQPIQDGGRLMVRRLFDLFDGGKGESVVLPHSLIVRESCGAKV